MNTARLYLSIVYGLILLKEIGVLLPSTCAVATECDCFYWQYCRQEDQICVDCGRCGNGHGAKTMCSQFNNTVCEPCPNETYSALSVKDNAYLCYPCTVCGSDRDTIAECNSEADTTCGPCPTGMFAYDNGTCLECSRCPNDQTATRYIECSVNGAPRNYLCVPGACPECGEHNVTINSSDGGWVTRKTDEVIFDDTTEPTTEDTTVVTVVSIVVATAVGLLVVFVSIFATWLLRAMYCSSYGLPGRQWQRQNNDEAALNLIQSFEASEEDTSSPTMVSITSTRVHYVQRTVPSVELLDVIGVIKEVEHKWSPIAEALGVGKDVVAEVDCACNGDTTESCRLMLDKWLKSADLSISSWKLLIKACNRNFLHSIAIKLEIFFAGDKPFSESDVVLWDFFVDQIKRETQKQFIIPRWHTPFDKVMVQLDVRVRGQVCSLKDAIVLLSSEESSKPIVLLGETGTGKTTMVQHLVENWCRVGSDSRFALVIYVNMATDAGKIIDLPSLINLHLERTVDTEMVTGMCDILVKQQGKGLMIILDSYDEIQDNKSDINYFLERLPKASFLLVCQPSYVTSRDYRLTTIEVSLLRSNQVEDYIQKTVGRRGIVMIRSSPLWPMIHYPLLLAIICHLIYHQIDVTRLSTLTQLYHHLVIKLVSDQVKGISYSGKDYSATVRSLLNSCAKASYEAMLNHQCSVSGIHDVNRVVESGLIVSHQNNFYFTHHTFLEFFTAYYVAHSSDIDSRALQVNPSDSLLLPFVSGLTGKIAYVAKEMDNNSLVATSVCYSEAKSPVTGQKHSATDTLGTLALNNDVLTHRQHLSLKLFMQEHKAPKQLNISGFTSNTLPLSGLTLTNKSSTTSDDVKIPHFINNVLEILNCEHLTYLIATDITITKEEWLVLVHVLATNNSLVSLNLSHNTSISDNDIIKEIAISLTNNACLQILMLSHCNLTSTYANMVMKSLLYNSCLLQIDLSNNLIEQLDVQIVAEVLKREIIQEINVASNPIIGNVALQLVGITYKDQKIITQ